MILKIKDHFMKQLYLILNCLLFSLPIFSQTSFDLDKISSIRTDFFDKSAAEILAYDSASQHLFFTNAHLNTVAIVDLADPKSPTIITNVDMSIYGGNVNAVDVSDGLVAVAIESDTISAPGKVIFLDTDGTFIGEVTVGVLPDWLIFNHSGTQLLTANEGAPSEDYTEDPFGSISIIDIAQDVASSTVTNVNFSNYVDANALRNQGIRIFGPGSTPSEDFEPEHIAISENDGYAFVSLQENNAMAVIDLSTNTLDTVIPLGVKDHSLPGNGLDASDVTSDINITTWPVFGMYMPDALNSVDIDGITYILSANEGDARDYTGFSEVARIKDLILDPTIFPNAAMLQTDDQIGRLHASTVSGDTDGDGDIDQIHVFGTRSFSIWNSDGGLVWDSGDAFEQKLAELDPAHFNSNNDDNDSYKNRSDDKGPEPSSIEIVKMGGSVFALIGLERMGGLFIYDISDPANPVYVNYVNNRNFDADPNLPEAGDLGLEDILFIDADASPSGKPLVVTANSVSGTVTVFAVNDPFVNSDFVLRIIHQNDGQSQLLPDTLDDGRVVGGVGRFKTIVDQLKSDEIPSITISSGGNLLPGPQLNASLSLPDSLKYYDAIALEAMGFDAIGLGIHDLDFGPDIFERFVRDLDASSAKVLNTNLDFSSDPNNLASVILNERQLFNIAGETVSIIGVVSKDIAALTSTRKISVDTNLVNAIQLQIFASIVEGSNKIILISHLGSIEADRKLVEQLTGLDVVISGGGMEFLNNNNENAITGFMPVGSYPMAVSDADGAEVLLVSTPGQYQYVGNLIIGFNGLGEVTAVDKDSGPILVEDELPDPGLVSAVSNPVKAYLDGVPLNILASTDVDLDGRLSSLRSQETNAGNLMADAILWWANKVAGDYGFDDSPIVALQNSKDINHDALITAGTNITEQKTLDIYPLHRKLLIYQTVTPGMLKSILENAVSEIGNEDGRFLQVAGFNFVWDTTGTPGSNRIYAAQLEDGTMLIENYQEVAGAPNVLVATHEKLEEDAAFSNLAELESKRIGTTDQRALFDYLLQLEGNNISAENYPENGEGRITTLQPTSINSLDLEKYQVKVGPNPFTDKIQVAYRLPETSDVQIILFDQQGRVSKRLASKRLTKGGYNQEVLLNDLSGGTYILWFQIEDRFTAYKLVKP